jgi:epsilon-lactone hydrolase
MTLSYFKRTILATKISLITIEVFNYNIIKNWTFDNLILFLKRIFKLAEEMKLEPEDVQWLFYFPKIFISTTYISKYIEFHICDSRCIWYNNFYQNPKTIILYFHGGGYCTCSPEAYYGLIDRIDKSINKDNVNYLFIDYPKAPEFKYPIAINVCFKIYLQISSMFPKTNFIFMGDSAGANLLIQVTNKIIINNIRKPIALICFSPWVISRIKEKYWKENFNKDFITPYGIDLATRAYLGFNILNKKWYSSILDLDYDNFPPMLIRAGSNELILDEIISLKEKIEKSNCDLYYDLIPNMPHAFDLFHGLIPDFDVKYKFLIDYIKKYLL